MFKVVSIDPKTAKEAVHWYPNENDARNAAFALYSHPLFQYKTRVECQPRSHIAYESGK